MKRFGQHFGESEIAPRTHRHLTQCSSAAPLELLFEHSLHGGINVPPCKYINDVLRLIGHFVSFADLARRRKKTFSRGFFFGVRPRLGPSSRSHRYARAAPHALARDLDVGMYEGYPRHLRAFSARSYY